MQSQNPSPWQIVSASDKSYCEQFGPSSQFTKASSQHFKLHHNSSGLTANTMQLELSAKETITRNPVVRLSSDKTHALLEINNEFFRVRALKGYYFVEGCTLARNSLTYLAMLQMRPTEPLSCLTPHRLPNQSTQPRGSLPSTKIEDHSQLSTMAAQEPTATIAFSKNNAFATVRFLNDTFILSAPDGHQFIPEKECFFDPATRKLSAPTRPN